MSPDLKASPPVSKCLFIALGMVATVAGIVTLTGYAIWSAVS